MTPEINISRKLLPVLQSNKRFIVILGGRGCVSGDTLIDTPSGQVRFDHFQGGQIYAVGKHGVVTTHAEKPLKYTKEQLYKVTLKNGKSIECTDQHRFLTPLGWRDVSSLILRPLPVADASRLQSTLDTYPLESLEDVQHCFQRLLSFLYCYYAYLRQCGLPLHEPPSTYLDVVQLLADEQQHTDHASMLLDDQGFENIHSSSLSSRHLSSLVSLLFGAVQSYAASENCSDEISFEWLSELCSTSPQSHENNNLARQVQRFCESLLDYGNTLRFQGQSLQIVSDMLLLDVDDSSYSDSLSCNHNLHYTEIESIVETSTTEYWDMFVPIFNNYMTNGIVSHNSGKSQGVADILLARMLRNESVACFREFQNSIDESVYSLLKAEIERLGLPGYSWTNNKLSHESGAHAIFRGLARNVDSVKSLHGFKIAWIEEAQAISEDSLKILTPTFRESGAQIIFTANPMSSEDAFSKRFIEPFISEIRSKGYYEDELH